MDTKTMNHKQEVMNKVLTLKNKLETTGKLTPKNKQELKQILIDTAPHEITFHHSSPFWNKTNADILTFLRNLYIEEDKSNL